MCTGIVETAEVSGSGKGPHGWFKLEQVNVSYDHPTDAQLDHAVNIDFVNEKEGPSARVAVELSPESARKLVDIILTTLSRRDPGAVRTCSFSLRFLLVSGLAQTALLGSEKRRNAKQSRHRNNQLSDPPLP